METKVQSERAIYYYLKYKYLNFIEVPPGGLSGGWFLWNSSPDFVVRSSSLVIDSYIVQIKITLKNFLVRDFYLWLSTAALTETFAEANR